MITDKQFVNTFEDIIQKRGAMDKLISDNAQVEVSGKSKTFSVHMLLEIGIVNPTNSSRTMRNTNTSKLKIPLIK